MKNFFRGWFCKHNYVFMGIENKNGKKIYKRMCMKCFHVDTIEI